MYIILKLSSGCFDRSAAWAWTACAAFLISYVDGHETNGCPVVLRPVLDLLERKTNRVD